MSARYIFFSGKRGVGKTTMACAAAVHLASSGKRTLIITTDPASNLADVFETEIGHRIRPLGVENLWGMEIDPDRATEEYREHILAPLRAVMPENVTKVMEEQFHSPCTTEIASFDRFVFVLQPEATSIYETKRSAAELAGIGIRKIRLIVNGILPEAVCDHPFFKSRFEMQQGHLEQIVREFPVPVRHMYQRDGEIKGLEALRLVARDLYSTNGEAPGYRLGTPRGAVAPGFAEWDSVPLLDLVRPAAGRTKTVFFTGKGGVGKTTVSCAAAYGLARRVKSRPAADRDQLIESLLTNA